MRKAPVNLLTALMLLAIVGDTLDIVWAPHPDNVRLEAVYDCPAERGKGPFRAVSGWEIDGQDGHAEVHRVRTPLGQRCYIAVAVMRAPEGWDGADYTKLYRGEWQILIHEEQP